MDNQLRVAIEFPAGTSGIGKDTPVGFHCPVPGARRFTHCRIKSTGEEIKLNHPRALDEHFGAITTEFLADIELLEFESDADMIARTSYKFLAHYQPSAIATVKAADLPASSRFIAAWKIVGGKVTHDAAKMRLIVLANLRKNRDTKLAESDGDKARLDEIGTPAQQKAVKEYRQKLRDLPAVVAAKIETMTVDQLENYKPQFPTIGE